MTSWVVHLFASTRIRPKKRYDAAPFYMFRVAKIVQQEKTTFLAAIVGRVNP